MYLIKKIKKEHIALTCHTLKTLFRFVKCSLSN